MDASESKARLKGLLWDYPYELSDEEIRLFLLGKQELKGIDRDSLTARLLLTFRWYDLLDQFGMDGARSFLREGVLQMIWITSIRRHYDYIRHVLERVLS